MKMLVNMYMDYYGKSVIIVGIMFIAMMAVYAFDKRIRSKRLLVYIPLIYMVVVLLNPIGYDMAEKIGGEYAYTRLYWVIPSCFIIAYAYQMILKSGDKKYISIVTIILAVICVAFGQTFFMYPDSERAKNTYHIPQDTVDVVDIILKDSSRNEKKVIAPEEISQNVRIYTSKLEVMFGKWAWNCYYQKDGEEGNLVDVLERQERLYREINSETPDVEYILESAWLLEWQYIVLPKGRVTDEEMADGWFNPVGSTDSYDVYGCLVIPDELKEYMEQSE